MKKLAFLLGLMFLVTSCGRMWYPVLHNVNKPLKKKVVLVNENKEIIHIPTLQANQRYYDRIKNFISEKRKEGYVVYYQENINTENLRSWAKKYQSLTAENVGINTDTDVKISKENSISHLEELLKNSSDKKIILLYNENEKYTLSKLFEKLNLKLTEGKFFPFHYFNVDVKK